MDDDEGLVFSWRVPTAGELDERIQDLLDEALWVYDDLGTHDGVHRVSGKSERDLDDVAAFCRAHDVAFEVHVRLAGGVQTRTAWVPGDPSPVTRAVTAHGEDMVTLREIEELTNEVGAAAAVERLLSTARTDRLHGDRVDERVRRASAA